MNKDLDAGAQRLTKIATKIATILFWTCEVLGNIRFQRLRVGARRDEFARLRREAKEKGQCRPVGD